MTNESVLFFFRGYLMFEYNKKTLNVNLNDIWEKLTIEFNLKHSQICEIIKTETLVHLNQIKNIETVSWFDPHTIGNRIYLSNYREEFPKEYISDLENRCKDANFAPFDDRVSVGSFKWDSYIAKIAEDWLDKFHDTDNIAEFVEWTDGFSFGTSIEYVKQHTYKARRNSWSENEYICLNASYPINGHLNPASNTGESIFNLPELNPDGTKNTPKHNPGQLLGYIVKCNGNESRYWGGGYYDYQPYTPTHEDMFSDDWSIKKIK